MPIPFKTDVIVAATTRDLTILDTVKSELGITTIDHDAWLQTKIQQASDIIAKACKRQFQQETLADHFCIDWCERAGPLILSRIPVVSVDSILENNVVVDASGYDVDQVAGRVWRRVANAYSSWNWLSGEVVVQFVGGYELLPTLPYDLEQACLLLIKQSWFAKSRDPLVRSVSIPGVASYDYWVGSNAEHRGGGFPPEVAQLIAPYVMNVAL